MCHTHRTWGTCTIFPQCTSLLLFKLVHASCSLRWIKRSKLGSRLVSANLVAPAVLAKTVACDGAREVRSCLWPDAASVEVAAGSHTTTLPHCHTSTLPRSPKVGTSTSVSSRFWAASSDIGARARCSRPATSPMESGALAFRQGRALSAHYSGVDQVARADVGAGDLGSFNKSPPPTQ